MNVASGCKVEEEADGVGVPETGSTEEIEVEETQQRPHFDALQAGVAAGQPRHAACNFEQQKSDAQGYHQHCRTSHFRDDGAERKSERAGGKAADENTGERFAPTMGGKQTCGVGAEPEERGMPEGRNAAIAKQQIKRHGKEAA